MDIRILRYMALALAACGGAAHAVTCTLTVPGVTFPAYTVNAASQTSVVVTLTCTKETGDGSIPWNIMMTAGSATYTRQLTDAAAQLLNYNLYIDSNYTNIWGDGTSATVMPTGTFDFTALAVGATLTATPTIYGLIPASQDLAPGTFAPSLPPMRLRARRTTGSPPNISSNVLLTVAGSITAACAIDSASNVSFGTYDPASATDLDATSSVVVRCTKTTPYTIALSAGGAGSFAPRQMTGAINGDKLNYNLYTTTARTTVWTTTTTVANTGGGVLTGAGKTDTVFARVTKNQNLQADTYSDTIAVTVTY